MAETFSSALAPDPTSSLSISPTATSDPTSSASTSPTATSDPENSPKNPGHTAKMAGVAVGVIASLAIILAILGIHQKRKRPRAGRQPVRWSRLAHKHPGHVQRGLGLQHQVLSQYDVGARSCSRGRTSRSRSRAPRDRDIEHSPAPPRYQEPPAYEEATSEVSQPPRAHAPPH
ncbi:MAG: hypothetical protein M1831_002824 [Alyxoria varia]|nr:MAG: hypothetical protein M1831_002824 [Alyxoria varia]